MYFLMQPLLQRGKGQWPAANRTNRMSEIDLALEMFVELLVHFTKLQILSLFLYLFSLVTFIFLSIWEGKNCLQSQL